MIKNHVKVLSFAVWAPHAKSISVVGDLIIGIIKNPMERISDGEVWVTFIPNLQEGDIYKYSIESFHCNERFLKADPYAFYAEKKPKTASRIYDLNQYTGMMKLGKKRKKWKLHTISLCLFMKYI